MMWTGKVGRTGRAMRGGVAWVAAGILSVSLLTGCGGGGGGNNDDSTPEPGRLTGTWRVSRIAVAGQSTDCAGEISYQENGDDVSVSCGPNDSVTFQPNGTFTGTSAGGGPYSGTWSLSDNTLTSTVTAPPTVTGTERQRVRFVDDNTFTAASEDGTTVTFTRGLKI